MHIGFDATSLLYNRGVSRYTANVIRELVSLKQDSIYAYGNSFKNSADLTRQISKLGVPKANIAVDAFPIQVLEKMWQFGLNPVHKKMPKIEVFHSWDWIQPPDASLPLVSTIHDLAILKFPETAHPTVLAHHQQAWEILKKRNAHIIAVSHSTKKDIVQLLGFNPGLIHVIHEALPIETLHTSAAMTEQKYEHSKAKLGLTRPYILAVGTREPRKNLERLIKAWQPFAKDIDLLIAGEKGWDATETNAAKFPPQLRFMGKVSDQELHVLYEEAEMLAYPSLDEGFGLPILEAFHHGTPVLTSDRSAMPEVAGNAALLINPESVESIRSGISALLNESPAEQKKRLQQMILRLQAFSWRQVAIQSRKVYQIALQDA